MEGAIHGASMSIREQSKEVYPDALMSARMVLTSVLADAIAEMTVNPLDVIEQTSDTLASSADWPHRSQTSCGAGAGGHGPVQSAWDASPTSVTRWTLLPSASAM
jgi:hypothetical protein